MAVLSGKVGVGFRPEIAHDLVAAPHTVDFIEVVAETCFSQRSLREEAIAMSRLWPVVPHGVKLSLGSAEGIDVGRVERLAQLAKELRAPCISEHVSFSHAGGREIGHLTQLPRTREAIRVVKANVDRARRILPDIPLLLENVAWSFLWPNDEMDEPTFYNEIVEATGCPLLLDLGNLFANAKNEQRDPVDVLLKYPLGHVAMAHVAGGVWEDGFYFDTHAHPLSHDVIHLVKTLLSFAPEVPLLIERDANFPWDTMHSELATLREAHANAPRTSHRMRARESAAPERARISASHLQSAQSEVARLLVDPLSAVELANPNALGIAVDAISRSRSILHRKRIDDALPLLPRLARLHGDVLRTIAERSISDSPRPATAAAPHDATRIAQSALCEPKFREAAACDLLVLRARYAHHGAKLTPRFLPFIGSLPLGDGTRIRVTKGVGTSSNVHIRQG